MPIRVAAWIGAKRIEYMEYNLYCDESCHLPDDGNDIMVLGSVWCPKEKVRKINDEIRGIKARHNIGAEMKWVKLSSSKKDAYMDIVKYFFDNEDLHFRVLVVDNKKSIDHDRFSQTHDEWYYKMYFDMIKVILNPKDRYHIYLDIKDTKSKTKIRKLKEILSNNIYDFSQETIENIQVIRSQEIEIMQITDVLIGAMAYEMRNYKQMNAKKDVIDLIKLRSGYTLKLSTLYREDKFNIFHLKLSEGNSYGY